MRVLFSFAQFEREVIGERIRDKFAASKQKGMWMGGAPPLGYDVVDRKLVINAREADEVRYIFRRFSDLRSITNLLIDLERGESRTKQYLYRLLKNKIYLGKISHKGQIYEGQHEAIISEALWQKAHMVFDENPAKRANYTKNRNHAWQRWQMP